jgi:type VI secretion system protein ImpG
MDREFLQHYNQELQFIRELSGEFAKQHPRVAGRLSLDPEGASICPDPYVERLLEGFAFLTARIQQKLSAEFPRFIQGLLETIYPDYLCPLPSMTIVQFQPNLSDPSLAEGFPVRRGSKIQSNLGKGDRTRCIFTTSHGLKLFPLSIEQVKYYTHDFGSLKLPGEMNARAGIHIQLRAHAGTTFSELPLDSLDFYVRGEGNLPDAIFEQVFAKSSCVYLRDADNTASSGVTLKKACLERVGFSEDEALLPYSPRSFVGYRYLREYFGLPKRFNFFRIKNLREAVKTCSGTLLDIFILFDKQEVSLENRIDKGTFHLFCTPAINLFPKKLNRLEIKNQFYEYHTIPDRTRPLDFEIYQIKSVLGIGQKSNEKIPIEPFYRATDRSEYSRFYYSINRRPRVLSARERRFGQRSSYSGSEVYISFVNAECAPFQPDLKELAFEAICSNRHLPMSMPRGVGRTDFDSDESGPWESIRCLEDPTIPKPSFAEGEMGWRIVSHLSQNYFSLIDSDKGGAVALRDLLRLYSEMHENHMIKQIEGVKSVSLRKIIRRVLDEGPVAFARGLEISLTFDESEFSGTGIFILGSVLQEFFAKYVSLNSFTETVILSKQRGEVMRWPAQIGQQPIV